MVRILQPEWHTSHDAALNVHAGARIIQELALSEHTFVPELPNGAVSLRDTSTAITAGDPNVTQPELLREYIYGEAHIDDVAVMIDRVNSEVYTYLTDQIGGVP